MVVELDESCEYGERSYRIRELITLAFKVESLLAIQKDPKKKQEFEGKFASLLREENTEQALEAMDEDQRQKISFFIENLNKKKVQLLIDEIKKS